MGKKVLVIDDSATIRQQVRTALAPNFDVHEASNGSEGLAKVRGLPDLVAIICDINMPIMDGIEFIEALKAELGSVSIPVVMLTTEGNPELISRARRAGAKGWIVKPFRADLLIAAMQKLTAAP